LAQNNERGLCPVYLTTKLRYYVEGKGGLKLLRSGVEERNFAEGEEENLVRVLETGAKKD